MVFPTVHWLENASWHMIDMLLQAPHVKVHA